MKDAASPPETGSSGTEPAADGVPAVAIRTLADQCAVGLCLVEPLAWRVVYTNAALRDWVAAPSDSTDSVRLSDWLVLDEAGDGWRRLESVATGELATTTFAARFVGERGADADAAFVACRVEQYGRTLIGITVQKASPFGATPSGSSQTDALTGLADRGFLMERLSSLVEGERSRDQQFAVLFIDVDGFKQINDLYGHLVGDRVLREVADRLATCIRSDDHLGRFGGDEFVVLLENVSGPDDIEPVVDRVDAAFRRPVELPGGNVTLTVSVGVARAEADGQTAEELLNAADRAMYTAKRAAT